MPGTESVKVIVRVRPLNSSEIQRGCNNVTQVNSPQHQLTISNPSTSAIKTFAYDAVYPTDCTQQSIYDETAFPLVESVIQGYNGTIFAYGQTGCGKTFTMVGEIDNPDLRGIIPNSFQHIFGAISEADDSVIFLVRCSYSEIYNEEIRDLLNFDPSNKLELKENKDKGIYVKGLSMQTVKTTADIEKAMEYGNKYRVTKGTNMNARSSRSHAIFTIYIETSETIEGQQRFKVGKLNLVDLAGSERQKKTGATGDRLKEGIKINLSLSALGNVISALVDGDTTHVPYRDSKLTRLLQDSLGGNTKTVMCAVISPADYNYDESLSTLRYASRAKFIQNKPTINEDPKDALLRQYADEIARLKALLAANGGGAEPIIVEKVVEKFIEVPVERKRRRKRQEGDNGRTRNADDEGDYEGGGTKVPSRRRKRTNGSQDYAEEEVIHGKSTTSRNLKGGQNGRADDEELRAVKGNNEVLRSRHRRKRREKAANNVEDETFGAASPLNSMNPQQRQKRVRRQQKESANNSIEELPEDDSEYQNSSQKRFKRRTTKKTQQLESDSDQESYTPYGDDPIPSHFGGGENLPTTRKNQIKRRQQVSTEVGDDNRKLRKKTLNTQSSKYIPTADDVLSPPANPPQVQSRRRKRPTLKEGRQPGRADQEKQEQISRDQLIEEQQQEQEKLKKLLDDLQHKLIAGGETLENFEIEKSKQQRAFRIKLKKQRKREQQLLEQNRQKEEEMLMKESQYQNLQEEVTDQRKLIKKLRIKYKASLEEVNDLNKEHEIEKEALFDTIRMRERDLEFLHHVFERILHPSEFQKIKQRSQYDEDNHTWHIPQFVLNQNTTQFPKLPKAQVKEIADRDLNARKVTFSDGGGQIQLNDKLRNARFDRMPSSDDEYGRGSNTYPFNSEKEEIHYTPSMQQMKPNKMTMLNPINASSLTNNGQMAAVGFRKKAPVKIKSSSQNPNRAILEPIHRRG